MLNNFRWFFSDALASLAVKIDPDGAMESARKEGELKVLSDIATGKIKSEDAQSAAFSILY